MENFCAPTGLVRCGQGRIPSVPCPNNGPQENPRKKQMNPDGFNGARMGEYDAYAERPAYFHCLSCSHSTNLLGRQDKGMPGPFGNKL